MERKWKIGLSAVALVVVCAVAFVQIQAWLRRREPVLSNPPVTGSVRQDTFYIDQLNPRERAVFDQIRGRAERLEGGVVTFEPPLTGQEVIRVYGAYQNGTPNYFYAWPTLFLDAENRIAEEDAAAVSKCLLVLSCTPFEESMLQITDGKIENLAACDAVLKQNNPEAVREIRDRQAQTQALLRQIAETLPDGAGQLDAVRFFADWITENVAYDVQNAQEHISGSLKTEEMFSKYLANSTTSCALDGKGMCVGMTKLLVALCSEVGIEAHLVYGGSRMMNGTPHAMVAVKINGDIAYLDTTNGARFGNRLMREEMMRNLLEPAPYFAYR